MSRTPTRPLLAALAASLLIAAAPAAAQQEQAVERWRMGGGVSLLHPQGSFAEAAGVGVGISGHAVYRLDPGGILGIRLGGMAAGYGQDRRRTQLSSTIGGRILVDVVTTNNLAVLGLGPQVELPLVGVRPYLHGQAGIAFLSTDSRIRSAYPGSRDERIGMTRHHGSATTALGAGGGVRVPLRMGRTPATVELGVAGLRTGEVEYLGRDDIVDNPDGSITLHPRRDRVEALTYSLGISLRPPAPTRRR
jgi:hypothetical protein